MTGIVVLFRTEDAERHAARLLRGLADHLPPDTLRAVGIGASAQDHPVLVADATEEVLLVLVGRHWASIAGADGRPCLEHEDDAIRGEIRRAIGRGSRIVVGLVNGARRLPATDLAPELSHLAACPSFELGRSTWHEDVESLATILRNGTHGTLPSAEAASPAARAVDMRPAPEPMAPTAGAPVPLRDPAVAGSAPIRTTDGRAPAIPVAALRDSWEDLLRAEGDLAPITEPGIAGPHAVPDRTGEAAAGAPEFDPSRWDATPPPDRRHELVVPLRRAPAPPAEATARHGAAAQETVPAPALATTGPDSMPMPSAPPQWQGEEALHAPDDELGRRIAELSRALESSALPLDPMGDELEQETPPLRGAEALRRYQAAQPAATAPRGSGGVVPAHVDPGFTAAAAHQTPSHDMERAAGSRTTPASLPIPDDWETPPSPGDQPWHEPVLDDRAAAPGGPRAPTAEAIRAVTPPGRPPDEAVRPLQEDAPPRGRGFGFLTWQAVAVPVAILGAVYMFMPRAPKSTPDAPPAVAEVARDSSSTPAATETPPGPATHARPMASGLPTPAGQAPAGTPAATAPAPAAAPPVAPTAVAASPSAPPPPAHMGATAVTPPAPASAGASPAPTGAAAAAAKAPAVESGTQEVVAAPVELKPAEHMAAAPASATPPFYSETMPAGGRKPQEPAATPKHDAAGPDEAATGGSGAAQADSVGAADWSRWTSIPDLDNLRRAEGGGRQFPAQVDAREDGGRVQVRARFARFPPGVTSFRLRYSTGERELAGIEADMKAQGYRQWSSNRLTDSKGALRTQSIWVR